jgi:Mg-chelatase subunit ChlD
VIFLVDASGSMAIEDQRGARARFDDAVEELERAVRTLPEGSRANIIFFSDRIWSWKPKVTELDDGLRRSVRRTLENQRPRGETYLYDGFEAAFADTDADTIVLLSDGQASGGKIREPDRIEQAILDWNVLRRLTIHCVAIGYHNPMLRDIAEKSGGRYLRK